ncbi:NTP transferase domain-containing protein [PVC group bacterium]|nr:NTP transferase domain-containing protein [PVC group bacterium]
MKAIILAAGIGSRIQPLTDNCPKSLLKIGNKTILERMISHIQDCGINEIIFITGYLENQIQEYVKKKFPNIKASFVTNENYRETNTGFSLLLAKDSVKNDDFIKFDADVVFDKRILKKLIGCSYENALCIDTKIHLDAEEIKVTIDDTNKILKASKKVDPKKASPENLFKAMKKDKKVFTNRLRFILAQKIGKVFISNDIAEEDIKPFLLNPRA